jgi:hypothetical protein
VSNRLIKFVVFVVLLVSMSLVVGTVTAQDAATQAKIDSAMSAGPASISKDATIFDRKFDADGKYVVLRAGTNGWYCLPDVPTTPGNDPACYDQTWIDAMYASRAGKPVNVTVPGIGYMLQGGDHPSYTDPAATKPAAGDDWHVSGPHLMIILPSMVGLPAVCTDAVMNSDNDCAMFPGTPLAHLMVPVGDMAAMGAVATQASS